MLLQPKEVSLKTQDGAQRVYILSKFPAIAGREIIAGYPISAMPKISEYKSNEELMLKLMAFVAVAVEGKDEPLRLTTRALVENHVPDWETLARIEIAMMEYNVSFFGNGQVLGSFEGLARKATAWIVQTLTDLSRQSSAKDSPRSRN